MVFNLAGMLYVIQVFTMPKVTKENAAFTIIVLVHYDNVQITAKNLNEVC